MIPRVNRLAGFFLDASVFAAQRGVVTIVTSLTKSCQVEETAGLWSMVINMGRG